jgi:hypothetical protein
MAPWESDQNRSLPLRRQAAAAGAAPRHVAAQGRRAGGGDPEPDQEARRLGLPQRCRGAPQSAPRDAVAHPVIEKKHRRDSAGAGNGYWPWPSKKSIGRSSANPDRPVDRAGDPDRGLDLADGSGVGAARSAGKEGRGDGAAGRAPRPGRDQGRSPDCADRRGEGHPAAASAQLIRRRSRRHAAHSGVP